MMLKVLVHKKDLMYMLLLMQYKDFQLMNFGVFQIAIQHDLMILVLPH